MKKDNRKKWPQHHIIYVKVYNITFSRCFHSCPCEYVRRSIMYDPRTHACACPLSSQPKPQPPSRLNAASNASPLKRSPLCPSLISPFFGFLRTFPRVLHLPVTCVLILLPRDSFFFH
ncbi:unnamed protein product [Ectocarpus sp. 4 AP-2014]